MNNRITELEKKVNKLESQFEQYIPIINDYKNEKEKTEKKEKEKIPFYEGLKKSNIVNKEEIEAIYNWLDRKPKNCKLLLDSKKDGDKTATFYEKCGGKSPTIVLVKTTEGKKFGGYTSIPWENKNNISKDNNSFIFSLNKMKKYKIAVPENAIQTGINYFAFGGGISDIYIENNCHSTNSNYYTYCNAVQYELNGIKEILLFLVMKYIKLNK